TATLLDHLAVLVLLARDVHANRSSVRDNHADITDLDHRLRNHLDGSKQAIDVVSALNQHLKLAATLAASREEALRVLERVVVRFLVTRIVADCWRNDFALRQRWPIVNGDDAHQVIGAFDYHRLEAGALFNDFGHPFKDS